MTMFSSRTAESMNRDPKPYLVRGRRYPEGTLPYEALFGDSPVSFDPRPEFTPKTAHPANPILVAFREGRVEDAPMDKDALDYLRALSPDQWVYASDQANDELNNADTGAAINATPEQIGHARRVLTRLATLKGDHK